MPSWALRQTTTSMAPPDRPVPDEPLVEGFEGEVLPYRGTELHGVPMFDEPRGVPGYHEGREVVYDEPEPAPDPVPVVIVQSGGRELRRARVVRSTAPPTGNPPSLVVGRDEGRSSVKVKNLGTDAVWIGHDPTTASVANGWRLKEDEEYTTTSEDTLYAMGSHATDQTQLAVSVDYSVAEE